MRELSVDFRGHRIQCYEEGKGPPLFLIHGIGPGTSFTANFAMAVPKLAMRYRVVGQDLVGFGRSERKKAQPYFDFEFWLAQIDAVVNELSSEENVFVLGHSMGGALALRLAINNPRVTKVLTSGAAGGNHVFNEYAASFLVFPSSRDELKKALRFIVYDASSITEEMVEERYSNLMQGDYKEYFEAMIAGDKQRLIDWCKIPPAELQKITADVLMVHGRDDLPCPADQTTLVTSKNIPKCDVFLLAKCGHAAPREQPRKFLGMALSFFG